MGWLTRAKYQGSHTDTFQYDNTGNRTSKTKTPLFSSPVTTSYTVATYSDLVTGVGSDDLEWSHGGQLTADEYADCEYGYDMQGRLNLLEQNSPVNLDIDFTYDVLGNRIMEVSDNGETETTRAFLYDREDVVVEFSDDDFTEVEKVYVHGPGIDEVLAVNIPDGEDIQTDHLFHDGLGSVTCYYEESAHWLDYKAFGQENTQSYSGIDFRYTGREFVSESDNDTELYYYRARYYRPDLGRFISKDPLGMIDGTNMFVYVQNNPVNRTDPWGLWFNGNVDPGYRDQDWICTDPAGLLNSNYCTKLCCKMHDLCYKIYKCNASSWKLSLFFPPVAPCQSCNQLVVGCLAAALINPNCMCTI
jgi:RHS repeat-associated protein